MRFHQKIITSILTDCRREEFFFSRGNDFRMLRIRVYIYNENGAPNNTYYSPKVKTHRPIPQRIYYHPS